MKKISYKELYIQESSIKSLLNRNVLLIVFTLLFTPLSLYAKKVNPIPDTPIIQQKGNKVKGKVTLPNGETVIGANVVIKGTTNGSITDLDGQFSLENVNNGQIILISYIGYLSQEINYTGQENISVVLYEDTQTMDDVVVIGYGTIKKSDLTGSVSSVSMDKLSVVGNTSADRALQGQVAGVVVGTRTGQPGDPVMIRIRGGNSLAGGNDPLYVIDGFPIEGMNSDINPEDIQSMEILKDASSTAIYGSRGANGVVLITTKRGAQKQTEVNYSGYISVSKLIKNLNLLGKDDYITLVNEASVNDGRGIEITPEQARNLPDNNWQDLTYQTALTHNHQLSVSGGNEFTKLYTSLNFLNQEGIVRGSGYDRFAFRLNGDQKITNKISIKANIAYSYGTTNLANARSADGGGGLPFTAVVMPPIEEIIDENGRYTTFKGTPWGGSNPVGIYEQYKNKTVNSRFLGDISLEYNIIKDLTLKITGGAEVTSSGNDRYVPIGLSAGVAIDGDAYKNKSSYYSLINENILTYSKTFNKIHSLNAVGGITFQDYRYDSIESSATGFLRDVYETNNLRAGSTYGNPGSGLDTYRMVSYLGRVNYVLNQRYLFTISGRYDGSSKFSKNNKFAFFPSAAIAWRLSEEEFIKDIPWLSNLKLRASFGKTGNQAISSYSTQARLSTNNPVFGNGQDVGFVLSSMANDDLKWETTTQTDIGIDFSLFNDRIRFEADYYLKQTKDLLYNATLPPSSGYTSIVRNIGQIDNKGFEFTLNTVNLNGAVNWTTNLNISINRSKVVDLGKDVQGNKIERIDAPITGGNWFPLFLGKSPFQLYGFQVEGIYQTNEEAIANGEATKKAGDYRYKELDGKPGIDSGDKTIISNLEPDFVFGITNIVNWKNFEFYMLLIGSVGNDIVNEFNKYYTCAGGSWNIRKDAFENRWIDGKGGTYPRPSADVKEYLAFGEPSTAWVENGSFLKCKELKITYRVPESIFKGSRKPIFAVSLSAQNLFTITKYSHYDPEVMNTQSSVYGWDRGVYPTSKSYTLGLQVKF